MSGLPLFDAAGRRRSPATMPGYHAGREPRNKGRTYPADPPTVEEIVSVMRQAGEDCHGLRARTEFSWQTGTAALDLPRLPGAVVHNTCVGARPAAGRISMKGRSRR